MSNCCIHHPGQVLCSELFSMETLAPTRRGIDGCRGTNEASHEHQSFRSVCERESRPANGQQGQSGKTQGEMDDEDEKTTTARWMLLVDDL